MPLLSIKTGESKNEFISRFMSDKTAEKEFPDIKQRVAVAHQKWRSAKESKNLSASIIENESELLKNAIKQMEEKCHS